MNKDNYIPTNSWEFNEDVTSVFGDMISRSIPSYEIMRELCYRIGRNFLKKDDDMYNNVTDIGCSNGLSVQRFIDEYITNTNFSLLDISEPMLDECRKKYDGLKNVNVLNHDIVEKLPQQDNNLVISCLTIQFTPIEYRQTILLNVYDSLKSGGALILVEKVLGNSYETNKLLVDEYYDIKKENGYSQELIQAKRKSLEGVLVPLTASFNEQMLRECGFRKIDTFWRCLNFCGWIAIK